MSSVLAVIALAVAAVFLAAAAAFVRLVWDQRQIPTPVPVQVADDQGLRADVRKLQDHVASLSEAVRDDLAETIRLRDETRKLDGRARYAVRSHLAKLEEWGLEPDELVAAAAAELLDADGGGGDPEGVLPMHPHVESDDAGPALTWRQRANQVKYQGG